jgi:MFS family permease
VKSTLVRVREVLAYREFRFLMAMRLISQLGDGLFQAVLVASVIFSPEKQSTAVGFAKAVAIVAVPFSVLGPFTGVFIDRWPRRLILTLTPALRAVLVLPVLFGPSEVVPFYLGALTVLSANRFFLTTVGAVLPRLVPSGDLLMANSLAVVGGTVATFLGIVLGGQLSDAVGFRLVLVPTVLIWITASALASRIATSLVPKGRVKVAEPLAEELIRVFGELRAGARRLFRTARALAPVTSITVDQFLQGVILVISLVVFRERFEEGVGSYSWLVAAGGAGVLVGLITIGPLANRLSRRVILAVSFAVSGVPLIAVAGSINRWDVLIASFLLGLSFAWKKIPVDTITQEAIPDAYRGRVFSLYDVAFNMARVVAALLAIPLLRGVSVSVALALCGAIFVAWIPVILHWLRRAATITVRTYAGARADEAPRSVVMAGVEEPVEVERSWREERAGRRLLCFRLRLPEGNRIEVSKAEADDRWRLDRELAG